MSVPALSQEALRNEINYTRFNTQSRSQLENVPYTFRWQDLRMIVSPTLSMAYDSNVRLGGDTPSDDFILTPTVNLNGYYPIGQANVLNLFANVGYTKYIENDDLDRMIVTPGSALSFDMMVEDLQINFHERFSYQLDPGLTGAVSGVGEYGGINNTVGTFLSWNLGDLILSGGYDFLTFINSSSTQDYQNRNTHQFLLRGGVRVHPAVTTGIDITTSLTAYEQTLLGDTTGYSFGGYAEWQVTEALSFRPRIGYVIYTSSGRSLYGATSDYDAIYFSFEINHHPAEFLSYSVIADRHVTPGTYSNVSDIWTARLDATWTFLHNWPFTTGVFFESGEEIAGFIPENYQRYGASAGVSYALTQRLQASLNYTFTSKDSELAARDYDQHRVMLTLSYRL